MNNYLGTTILSDCWVLIKHFGIIVGNMLKNMVISITYDIIIYIFELLKGIE